MVDGGPVKTGAEKNLYFCRMTPCANCGHERSGRYCTNCGQNDRDYTRSLPPVLGEILKETFELDSRVFRTIKPMFLRPGELPKEFSRNRRASYISPIRLYIFASIAFFFLLSFTADLRPRMGPEAGDATEVRLGREAGEDTDVGPLKALLPPPQKRKVDEIIRRPGMPLAKSLLFGMADGLAELEEPLGRWELFGLARVVDLLEDPRSGFGLLLDNLPFAMFVTLPAYALLLMIFFVGSRRFFTEHLVFAVQLHTFAFIIFTVMLMLPDGDNDRPRPPPAAVTQAPGEAMAKRDVAGVVDAVAENDPTADREQAESEDSPNGDVDIQVSLKDESGVFAWLQMALFLWVFVYHYLALRRYYGNGRFRTAVKWGLLTFSYAILLIPGFMLSVVVTLFEL